jgi:hypothetical protein
MVKKIKGLPEARHIEIRPEKYNPKFELFNKKIK